ncbi:N-acetyltransferase 10 [Marasmius crinis-equi]|uniref:RNA cytidine acetyltransferase n=1 Tax=Marasmius crinis-equi TaxID=585013 RepID=A0ABR3FTS0_9AGAR
MRKQLDPRIQHLINNNVKKNHRSFIVLVGDKGRDQIVNLHFLLSQARVSARPSVLWCYKKDLGFTTHRKKMEAKIKRDVKKGIREPNDQNPFEIFVTVTDIRYTYYKESHKILGHTYGMLVLQDFEAITPNLLARTIETVQGGGLVVLLLKTMSSLRQLYSMTMDVHSRYRTSAHNSVTARFNERFILSLGSCPDCLFLDDELNVLPISKGKDIVPYEPSASTSSSKEDTELKELRDSLSDTPVAGPLIQLAKTTSQAQAVLTFIDSISSKTLSSTCTLTSARGRGKSAALGLGIAAAVAHGYANIFVTSPTPENLQTAFEFIFKGFDALGYEEHLDYDILQTTNPEWGKAIVRVNIFKSHRQTIQYIQPQDAHVLGQAELVVIDEAAAIPLPLVRELMGPYLVFLASTINGYEGTGRSLSLKLIKQLREEASATVGKDVAGTKEKEDSVVTAKSKATSETVYKSGPKASRSLHEIKLTTPIRYSDGDKIESWLNTLLCLDATLPSSSSSTLRAGCPHPSSCTLYRVNRDTLFSFHPASEAFLQRMMALYVASHYKNQPNDLQLMSDAPAHELYVLLPPLDEDQDNAKTAVLPTPLAVIQVALEGRISKDAIMDGLSRGLRAGGDMIPWLVAQQYQEGRFAELSGARVVRVAVDPEMSSMGYGSRALQALNEFYSGDYINLDEIEKAEESYPDPAAVEPSASLLTDKPTVRSANAMPPLLQRLSEVKPPQLDYLGVSYGLTGGLLRFWKRLGFVPLYIRHTASDLTGEHTCVMVRGLNSTPEGELEWLGEFAVDFRTRLLTLLSFPKFREFSSVLGLSILESVNNCKNVKQIDSQGGGVKALTPTLLPTILSPFDLKRLESYGNNMLDYHVILDLMPTIASLFFQRRLTKASQTQDETGEEKSSSGTISLSAVQSAILLGMGLQRKSVEDVETELSLPVSQTLALLVKVIRKISKRLMEIQRESVVLSTDAPKSAPEANKPDWKPVAVSIEDELEEAGEKEKEDRETRERQREMINSLDLRKYAIDDTSMDWSVAEAQVNRISGSGGGGGSGKQTVVSVRKSSSAAASGTKRKADDGGDDGAKKTTRRGGKKAKR